MHKQFLDDRSWSGSQEFAQTFLLHAIQSLEKTYASIRNIIQKARTSSSDVQQISTPGLLDVSSNLKRTLDQLLLLRVIMNSNGPDYVNLPLAKLDFSATPNLTSSAMVLKQKHGFRCSPSLLPKQPSALHTDLISCTQIQLVKRWSVIRIIIARSLLANHGIVLPRTKPCRIIGDIGAQDRLIVKIVEEKSETIPPPHWGRTLMRHPSKKELSLALKSVRQLIELRFATNSDPISKDIVNAFELIEVRLCLTRDSRTNSYWNADYQEYRNESFQIYTLGTVYRLKCECDMSIDGVTHSQDVYCPRNIEVMPVFNNENEVEDITEPLVEDIPEESVEEIQPEIPEPEVQVPPEADPAKTFQDMKDHLLKMGGMMDSWDGKNCGIMLIGPPNVPKVENDVSVRRTHADTYQDPSEKSPAKEIMSDVLDCIGQEDIKEHFKRIKTIVALSHSQLSPFAGQHFGMVLMGKSGLERKKMIKLYARYLIRCGISPDWMIHTTASDILDIDNLKEHLKELKGGGVLSISDAHLLHTFKRKQKKALKLLWETVSDSNSNITVILSGEEQGLRRVLGENSTARLFPYIFLSKEPTEADILAALVAALRNWFGDNARVEDGWEGLSLRVAARRLAVKNKGNDMSEAVKTLVSEIFERQSKRLAKEQEEKNKELEKAALALEKQKFDEKEAYDKLQAESVNNSTAEATEVVVAEEKLQDIDAQENPDSTGSENPMFSKDDILGPSPSDKILESESWKSLQRLTGLQSVKQSLINLTELAKTNYERELQEKPPLTFTFNRLFLGPPGVGKTVVAKLYGQILAEIGVLSTGNLIVKNASDLIGKYVGWSEAATEAALEEAKGGILVIDEAYMLYTTNSSGENSSDVFRRGVIDTLVGGIQNVPGEDRCVIMLGYEHEMKEMIMRSNPGLARRFPIEDAFVFENFSLKELEEILRMKLEEYKLEATEEAIKVAMDVLDKARSRMNFGNGGAVENLITRAKSNCLGRMIAGSAEDRLNRDMVFEPQDFDPEHDRGYNAADNLHQLFSDVIGCEGIVEKFGKYQKVSRAMKLRNIDPRPYIPTNFVFKGPPGSGKTTTARKIAQIYYDMGFLSEPSVIECSTTDLIGTHVGQTGPKTIAVLERGLGKVLFIDEAYRLAPSDKTASSYATEALSELVDSLTKPKFLGKIIVILAGYEEEMNSLLAVNPGLASRFSEEVNFALLSPQGCLKLLHNRLAIANIAAPVLNSPWGRDYSNLERLIRSLALTKGWGNARDIITLAQTITRDVFVAMSSPEEELVCTAEVAALAMEDLLEERLGRAAVRGGMGGERGIDGESANEPWGGLNEPWRGPTYD